MTISLDVNTLKIDADDINDHVTFRVTQTGEQSFLVRTFVDTSGDGFGKFNSDTTKTFTINTPPNWYLSRLKFEDNKLVLLGHDATCESLSLSRLIPKTTDKRAMEKLQLDKEIAENAGILGALRDPATLDPSLRVTRDAEATGLNMEKQRLDREIAENAGILGALRDPATLDSSLRVTRDAEATGLGGVRTAACP